MKNKIISYRNTDLDVRSDKPFDSLVKGLTKSKIVYALHYEQIKKNQWMARFELENVRNHNPEKTIRKFIKFLNQLSPSELKIWNACERRIMSIGFDCLIEQKFSGAFVEQTASYFLSHNLVDQLGRLGLEIEMVFYPECDALYKTKE